MSYLTLWEEKGIKWIFSGNLTNDDLLQCNRELYEDSRFLDIEYEICDFRAVKKFPVESKIIQSVAKLDMEQSKRNPHIKVAIIADQLVMKGLVNMYQIVGYDSPWETQLFENEDDAKQWINT